MLPDISLDDETYEEILDEARNGMISRYPEWTNYNGHDPGVTLLELFAMLKESQQYFADRIGEAHRRAYLKLLGIRRRTKQPARSLIQVHADRKGRLFCGQKLEADGLCFETARSKQMIRGDVACCMAVCGGREEERVGRDQMEFGGPLHFRVFGRQPQAGNMFYLCLEEELPVGTLLDLYIEVDQGMPVKRNPLRGFPFVPLAELEWQYASGQGWQSPVGIRDETEAFLFSGFLRFELEADMERVTVHGRTGYFLRAVLREGEYDVPPVLTKISFNVCEVMQRDTLAECHVLSQPGDVVRLDTELAAVGKSEVYLERDGIFYPAESFERTVCWQEGSVLFRIGGELPAEEGRVLVINRENLLEDRRFVGTGNGFPCQEIRLEDRQMLEESVVVLVQDAEHPGGFRLWSRVEDFANSNAGDRHYIFDSRRGSLLFGDCRQGMAPEGHILMAGYVRTMGSDGNVRAGAIRRIRAERWGEAAVSHIGNGLGGCDEETLEEAFLRAGRESRQSACAVTGRDYETLVRQTPGLLIESCKALSLEEVRLFWRTVEETAVYLAVKCYSRDMGSRAEEIYAKNIRGYLEQYRTLGSRIEVLFPEYAEVEVYVEAAADPQYLDAGEKVQRAVRDFFERSGGELGGLISYSGLYGDLEGREFILEIRSLSLESRGNGVRRNEEGDILLSPNGIAVLGEVRVVLH